MVFATDIGIVGLVLGGLLLLVGRKRDWASGLIGSSYFVGIGFLSLGISRLFSQNGHTRTLLTLVVGVVGIALGIGFLIQGLVMPMLIKRYHR